MDTTGNKTQTTERGKFDEKYKKIKPLGSG